MLPVLSAVVGWLARHTLTVEAFLAASPAAFNAAFITAATLRTAHQRGFLDPDDADLLAAVAPDLPPELRPPAAESA